MNTKIVKDLRRVAFAGVSQVEERQKRPYAIEEDKKGRRRLRCLDPRAYYLALKDGYRRLDPKQRIAWRKELKNAVKNAKEKFQRGNRPLSEREPTLLGHPVTMQSAGKGVWEPGTSGGNPR